MTEGCYKYKKYNILPTKNNNLLLYYAFTRPT